ncbi:MAG: histidine kinase [Blastocatellia bacterium AA13]|nr:MAG: histidine kinase [Blastocatellia bacterium AA13]
MGITLLLAEDNPTVRKIYGDTLSAEGYTVIQAEDGDQALDALEHEPVDVLVTDLYMPGHTGLELVERGRKLHPELRTVLMTGHGSPDAVIEAFRYQACAFLSKPFSLEDLRGAVTTALEHKPACGIEVVSAKPDWIELLVPCDLHAVAPLQKLITELDTKLPVETREAIGSAFREMLGNAIEHGGKCDPAQRVVVKYVRLKRAIMYSIKDPGNGFDIAEMQHAAITNPTDEPLRHMQVRAEKGIRPGGYGILLASQVIDELIYNERHNELIFVKYVDTGADSKEDSRQSDNGSH